MENRRKPLVFILSTILLILCLSVFFVMAILVINRHIFFVDRLNNFVVGVRTDFWNEFFKVFTYFGQFYFLVIVLLLMLIFVRDKRIGLSGMLGLVFASVFNLVVKSIIRRPRPTDFMIIEEIGHSFPSAHAMLSILVFGLIIYFLSVSNKPKVTKVLSSIILSIIILMTGFSRVYLGVHYASDILAGWLAGIAFIILTVAIYKMFKTITFNKIGKH